MKKITKKEYEFSRWVVQSDVGLQFASMSYPTIVVGSIIVLLGLRSSLATNLFMLTFATIPLCLFLMRTFIRKHTQRAFNYLKENKNLEDYKDLLLEVTISDRY